MENKEQINSLIDAIIDGDAVESEKAFNDLMAAKVSDRIETYRQDVADSYFNPVAETDEEGEEDTQLEDEEENQEVTEE